MKKAIVVGGSGTLGKTLIKDLKEKSFKIISLDINENKEANYNILINKNQSLSLQYNIITNNIQTILSGSLFSGVFCTAGGWMGGKIGDNNFLNILEQMNLMNLETAALSSNLAVNYLDNNGLLILTGAQAALNPCPNMIGYGVSKSATHYLLSSIVKDEDFIKKSCRAYGILPNTIDTPANRAAMPGANHLSWTKVFLLF